jgi:6-hydroxynicotinate 3-monooxygenase
MNGKKRIAVIGAGLGGLSVAGFLQRAGFPVKVYEQAAAFSRIGAGIILSANAMKAFRRLGIEQSLVETGIKPKSYVSRAWDSGETMYEIQFDAASEARYGGPYLNIHRGDLHGVLERVVAPGTIAFKDVEFDLLLPGITISGSPTDYRSIKQLQMMRFNGERWEGFGPIITDDYSG